MSTEWYIKKNPNTRGEKYLSGLAPFDWAHEKYMGMRFGTDQANKISRLLLGMGISHYIEQATFDY